MTANQIFIATLFVTAFGSLALNLAAIRWGLKWAHLGEISWKKALGLLILFVVATCVVDAIIIVAFVLILRTVPEQMSNISFGIAMQFVVASLLIACLYGTALTRAAKAALPYVAVQLLAVLLTVSIIRPLTYECFAIPTNGMAPTLLGDHVQLTCPNCGSPAYGSPPDVRKRPESDEIKMICSTERRTVLGKNDSSPVYSGDRITACKLITPRRWDIIVFRVPCNPTICYVSRLVGLPNEELEIRDGTVWISGEKQTPPDSIREIPYAPTVTLHGEETSGPGSKPVTLGSDEYYVLGDFPDNAFDSRFWREGAPGHPPYALPKANIVGVVINVYWPPSRWAAFR